MFPQAFLIFLGSDLGVCGKGDSHSGRSVFTVTISPVWPSVTGWFGSGSGHVLERERASALSSSKGAYSIFALQFYEASGLGSLVSAATDVAQCLRAVVQSISPQDSSSLYSTSKSIQILASTFTTSANSCMHYADVTWHLTKTPYVPAFT